jgi:molybdenum cofactor cytidylyltransferase
MSASPALPILDAVVPAAGRSRRAGVLKPAALVRGRPLLAHAVASLQPCCRRIVVVTGWRAEQVAALVAGGEGVATVLNPRFDEGMFTSVQAGAAALAGDAAGFFVLPADCPFVARDAIAMIIAAFAAVGGARAVTPRHAGRGGHPVLLPAAARQAIAAASGAATLRDIVAAFDPVRLEVPSPSVLADIDTPGDLARLDDET